MGAKPLLGRTGITKPYRRGRFSQRCEHAQYVSFLEPNRSFLSHSINHFFPSFISLWSGQRHANVDEDARRRYPHHIAHSALPPGIALQDVWTRRPRAQCNGLKQGLSSRGVRSIRCSSNQVVSRHNGPICHRFKVLPASAVWANNASNTGSKTQL